MDNYQNTLEQMVFVAKSTGDLTLNFASNRLSMDVQLKGPADFFCQADADTETHIISGLKSINPDWSFRGEETGLSLGSQPDHEWLVDPIDGTTNFLSGMHYTISIALRHNDATVCGVLYNPIADEMFTAVRGGGAFLNGEPISANQQSEVNRFVVGTGIPTSNLRYFAESYDRLQAIREPIGAIRILGSCANSLAHVACGRLNGYFEGPTGLVDMAVGVLLVEESGGVVSDFWGRDRSYWESNTTLVAGSSGCHSFLLQSTKTAKES